MLYIYTVEYYSTIKKNEIMLFVAPWMSLKIVILSEVSQTEKNKYHMTPLFAESKGNDTDEITKQKEAQRVRAGWQQWVATVWLPVVEGTVREFGMAMYILLYLKWITRKVYCIAPGTLSMLWE